MTRLCSDFFKDRHVVGAWGKLSEPANLWSFGKGEPSDVFDLASLTKPILISSLLMMTCERSQKSWSSFMDTSLSEWVPEWENSSLKNVQLRHLWEHRSGLKPHIDFMPDRTPQKSRSEAWRMIVDRICQDVSHAGLLEGTHYSDLGFLILGYALERFHEQSLQELWTNWKLSHGLSTDALNFFGTQATHPRLVVTESRHARGEVNDNNAFLLKGVAPHAGLMGTAIDVWDWARAIQRWGVDSPKISTWMKVPDEWSWRFYCGWDTPEDPETTTAGRGFEGSPLGHLGFTGTAFWFCFEQNLGGVLLTNRVFPAPSPESAEMVKFLRREFFSALWQGTLSKEWQIPINKNGFT